jgi:tape measure domain-containing protein
MVIRELLTKLGFAVDNSGLDKYEKGTKRVKANANDAAASFRNMFAAFAGIAAIRSISRVADEMQSLEARIGMLPQTIGDSGKAFDEVAKHATANRQSIDAYGSFYTKVGNAAKGLITDQNQLLQVTDTISQALVVGGASTQEAQSAMLQFGQALGSGVLQGDEFRSMAEAAPQYLDALSEAMNIPRENLKKMASQGKLTSKAVIEATLKMSSTFEDKFKKIPLTIGQATTIMGNKWAQFIAKFNRETMIVTKVANFIVSAMDKIGAGLTKFIKSVGGADNALTLLVIVAGSFFAIWISGWLAAAAATLAATWPILAIAAALALVALLFEDVYGWFMGYDSLLGDAIGGVGKWRTEVENITAAFNGLMTIVGALWEYGLKPILGFTWFAFLTGLKAVNTIFGLIFSTVSAIVTAIKAVGNFFAGSDVAAAMQGPGANAKSSGFLGNMATGGAQTNNQNVTVNVPPGTSAQTMEAARQGAMAGLNESPDFFSRQMGQAL